jgi:hypothetical protein
MSGYGVKQYDAMGVVLKGNSQGQLSVSGTAAQTSAFTVAGMYDVWCDVDVYLKVATTANDVTTSTGYLLRVNTTVPFKIDDGDKLGAISASSGTLRFHKVS